MVVTGGPGTGKTTLAVLAAADAVRRGVAPETSACDRADRVPRRPPQGQGVGGHRRAHLGAHGANRGRRGVRDTERPGALLGEPRPSLVSARNRTSCCGSYSRAASAAGRAAPRWGGGLPDEATLLPAFVRNCVICSCGLQRRISPEALHELGVADRPPRVGGGGENSMRSTKASWRCARPADQGAGIHPATIASQGPRMLGDVGRRWEESLLHGIS